MRKFTGLILMFLMFVGCTTNNNTGAGKSQISLPVFENEYARAVDYTEAKELASNAKRLSKIHNDMRRYYAYTGSVYDRPIKNDGYFGIAETAELKNIGYPMSGSTQYKILWDCIEDFYKETGMRVGHWFEMHIKICLNEIEINKVSSLEIFTFPDMYFIGRLESTGSIKGIILRKP